MFRSTGCGGNERLLNHPTGSCGEAVAGAHGAGFEGGGEAEVAGLQAREIVFNIEPRFPHKLT